MSNRASCSYRTRRGKPCRNPAAPGAKPPACAVHRAGAARQRPLPFAPDDPAIAPKAGRAAALPAATPPAGPFYFPTPTAGEQAALEASGAADLRAEVALARLMLRRLKIYLDENGDALPPDELRRLVGLIFSGTRTVGQLLARPAGAPAEAEPWLLDALAALERRSVT